MDLKQRREIERLYAAGAGYKTIAEAVGISVPTVYRELKRGGADGESYSADLAEAAFRESLRKRGNRSGRHARKAAS